MDRFYEVFKHAIDQFPEYHMKIFLDFYEKVMTEDTFKLATWNKSLYEIKNVNRVGFSSKTLPRERRHQ